MNAEKTVPNLLWFDFETTGLDETIHCPIEAAAVVTDYKLKVLSQVSSPIHATVEQLEKMNDVVRSMHMRSGLLHLMAFAPPCEVVEEKILQQIDKSFAEGEKIILCGNSIHFDRKFIRTYMPKLEKRLHYRMIDVSSFKESFRVVYGYEYPRGTIAHRALPDIMDGSIPEFQTYLQFIHYPDPLTSAGIV